MAFLIIQLVSKDNSSTRRQSFSFNHRISLICLFIQDEGEYQESVSFTALATNENHIFDEMKTIKIEDQYSLKKERLSTISNCSTPDADVDSDLLEGSMKFECVSSLRCCFCVVHALLFHFGWNAFRRTINIPLMKTPTLIRSTMTIHHL